jgi:Protein of unknown function (DUF1565)/S-layer homology domain
MVQAPSNRLYVNPSRGNDANPGSQTAPLKTLTKATQLARAGAIVELAPGNYSATTGEQFPIVLSQGVTVQGDAASQGKEYVITGGGRYTSPIGGEQNITLRLENAAQLTGVTVTNLVLTGTGVWIESSNARVDHVTLANNSRQGIAVTGNARPLVADCVFKVGGAAVGLSIGLSIGREAKGEYRNNLCQDGSIGIAVGDNAAPLLVNNRTVGNQTGIRCAQASRPVLRGNVIERNTQFGLVVQGSAWPDLGTSQDPGENLIRDNQTLDLQNATNPPLTLSSVGNQLNPMQVDGEIALVANEVPPPLPIEVLPPPIVTPVMPVTPIVVTPVLPAPPIVIPVVAAPVVMSDIKGHWAEGFIQALLNRGIITGFPDATFKPEMPVTRVQYAAMLAKTYDLPFAKSGASFSDVTPDFWGFGAITKAFQMGFIAGFPDRTFRPGLNLTRVQAILSLVNGLQLKGGPAAILNVYGDRAQVPSYAIDAVATATQRKMVVNHPNLRQLDPLRDITRAEVSALLYQSLVSINRAVAIASPDIVGPDLSALNFTDIEKHWAKDFILPLVAQDLLRGYADGGFKPDLAITRVQFATAIARAFNPAPKQAAVAFSDVLDGFWGRGAIDQVQRGNFLSGFADGTFRPEAGLTRLELVQAMVNGLGLGMGDPTMLGRLTDRASIPTSAQGQVAAAIQQKILVNYPDLKVLNPTQPATRAAMTAMIYQAMARSRRVAAIASPYILA